MTKGDRQTIYVELLEEGTPCWRPVEAVHLGSDLYRIVGAKPQDEDWSFSTRDIVRCKMKTFQAESPELVAEEQVNQ